MQAENIEERGLAMLLSHATGDNLMSIVTFLGREGIQQMVETCGHGEGQSRFLSLCGVCHFVNEYLTRTDRTLYMSFYDHPTFQQKEQLHLSHLTQNSPAVLHYLSRSHRTLLTHLSTQLTSFENNSQVLSSISQCLTDPELPMPKLRKQNIGRHCQSAFQFFLVDRLFPSGDQMEAQEASEELRLFLGQQIQEGAWLNVGQWSRVGYQNYQGFLITGNALHNFVVVMVALVDLLVDTTHFYIQSIHDPLHAFIEFNLRYCLFRNVILSLQERFGLIFQDYSQRAVGKEGCKVSIWHCALSKWYQHMQVRHQEQFKAYFYLLKKVNLQSIRNNCDARSSEHAAYIEIGNRLQLEQIDLLEKAQWMPVYSEIETFFDANTELYKQLIKEYTEYFMDISINEYSVHWCGHSRHHLHLPYQDFQQLILTHYHPYLEKLMTISNSVASPKIAVDAVFKTLVDDLGKEYLKPVTLKKIIDETQTEVTITMGEEQYCKMQLAACIESLNNEFASQDKVLEYFNQEASIPNEATSQYSIALEQPQSSKCLQNSTSTNTSGPSRPQKEGMDQEFS